MQQRETECLEAIYEGRLWNASTLKRPDGTYDEERRLTMRRESQARQFYCPECGENLILNAGNIREPFFRHYADSDCVFAHAASYAKSYQTRSRLYDLAKRSFPQAEIIRYAAIKGTSYRTQILINTLNCKMALNYIPETAKIGRVEELQHAMEEQGIITVWFNEYKPRKFEERTTIQYMIEKSQPILKFIDLKTGKLYLKEYPYENGKETLHKCAYLLGEVQLKITGEFDCDFRKWNEGIIKELPEELISHEKEYAYGKRIYEFIDEQGMMLACNESEMEYCVKKINMDNKMIPGSVPMPLLHEYWLLKRLIGPVEKRERAQRVRKAFLTYVDSTLAEQKTVDQNHSTQPEREILGFLRDTLLAEEWLTIADYLTSPASS